MPDAPTWIPVEGPLTSFRTGNGPRIVFVHGFTQTSRSWLPVADTFATDHEVILIDAPGHGGSGHVRADLRLGADFMANVGGRAIYVGYSMGARFLLHLALAYPHLLRGLVLLSGTAGISNDDERNDRRAADDAIADDIEKNGVEQFVDRWLSLPMFASLPDYAKGLEERVSNTGEGLASSLRLAGVGAQLPLWDRIGHITAPTLTMAGDLDPKFVALGQQLAVTIGRNAVFRPIEAAGHAAHLEHPFAVVAAIRDWMTVNKLQPRAQPVVHWP